MTDQAKTAPAAPGAPASAAPAGAGASAKAILLSTAGALATATALLFAFVLPAEIGFDPLGTGKLLGLTGLAAPPPKAALTEAAQASRSDEAQFELSPGQGLEYKYVLAQGAAMTFSWKADGKVAYDMHSEPEGGPAGYAESFAVGAADHQDGTYVAPFPGIHGWYWENQGDEPVTVRLRSAGFYTGAAYFGGAGREDIEIPEADWGP